MVAKIKSGKSLIGALIYNENKVKAGKAVAIASNGYLNDLKELSFHDKLSRLTDLAQRNQRTKTNTVHISLNFHIHEKLDQERLTQITEEYMALIGFGDQPYLVYEHKDAGHPHLHIVTTNIQPDGKRISLHYIGEKISEPAREEVEVKFGLVQAKGNRPDLDRSYKLSAAEYGKSDTKRVITNIVNEVTRSYKYTSLPELNAILSLYNITADRGSKESVMFKHGGLNYWITDDTGKEIGVPIKASNIYKKPTFKFLESRFRANDIPRKPLKNKLGRKIDKAIAASASLEMFELKLREQDISVIIRQNTDGRIYGLSYIDLIDKVIFNGSDLGKAYSAVSVLQCFKKNMDQNRSESIGRTAKITAVTSEIASVRENDRVPNLLQDLLTSQDLNPGQGDFGPRRKKKKRRKMNL